MAEDPPPLVWAQTAGGYTLEEGDRREVSVAVGAGGDVVITGRYMAGTATFGTGLHKVTLPAASGVFDAYVAH